MKISPITSFYGTQYKKEQFKTPEKGCVSQNTGINFPGYNDYMLSFGARVDKGVDRFYETNKDRMPQTVKIYIESLDDKSKVSPLEAQQKAYELLEIAQSVEDIKNAYSDEQLFKDLINPLESRATRGILNSLKENDELLKLSGQGVLKDKSNLTVYLVKKVFLENKTVDVNQLDININDEETSDSTSKNEDANILQFMIYQKSKALKHKKLQDLTQQEFAIQQLDNELVFQNKQVHKLKNAISQLEKSIEEDEQTKEKLQSENQYLTSDERVKNLNDIDTLNANIQNKHLQIDQAKNNIDKVKEKIEVIQLKKEDVQNGVFDFQKPVEVEIKK